QEVIHKRLVLAGKYQSDLRRIEVKPFPADLGLPLEARKIETSKILVGGIRSEYQNTFNKLSQEVLMVKRHMSTPVLKRKNYPGSQNPKKLIGAKKLTHGKPPIHLSLCEL